MAKIKKDITNIVNQYLCHSCGSCFASCGHDCISYENTVGGYLFPKIDYDLCTSCELCYDVCPGDHFTNYLKSQTPNDPFVGNIISSYVGKSQNEKIYKNSQSGGVVTALLKYLLESGKISAAIVTSMNMESISYSEAKIVTTVEELITSQKSKYVPTNINSLMQKVSKIDGTIAMVGLSCHMHGLENLLTIKRKLRNKIFKIGLICDRVMTSASIDFLSQKVTNNKIKDFVFRDTLNTPYPGDITVTETNGKLKILDKKSRMLMKDYFTPARCLLCFDKMNIYADIVIGDPHGIQNVNKVNGESLVLVRTDKGKELINNSIEVNEITMRTILVDEAIKGQSIISKRKKWNAHYKAWEEMGYDLPSYPENIELNSIQSSKKEIQIAKKNLEQALSLDKYNSRDLLIKNANNYYKFRTIKSEIRKKINLIKRIIK
jgi:coenzyme F420 hydrogenase subunit beta